MTPLCLYGASCTNTKTTLEERPLGTVYMPSPSACCQLSTPAPPSAPPQGWWGECRDYRSWLRQAALSLPGWTRCLTAQLHPSQHHPSTVPSRQRSRESHGLSQASEWMKTVDKVPVKSGRMRVGRDERGWWRWTMTARLPSGLSLFKQTSATSPNIRYAWRWRLAGLSSLVVRIQNRANIDCMGHSKIGKHFTSNPSNFE